MKVALIVHEIVRDVDANLRSIQEGVQTAAEAGAELVVFCEAALTGLVNNDDPVHDLPLGRSIPGFVTDALGTRGCGRGLYVALGLLERDGDRLYDSAVLLGPAGDVVLHYRRIHPGWHGKRADPAVHRQGMDLPRAETELGTFAFPICGDLFDDVVAERARALRVDWILFPFWRSFENGSCHQERWVHDEQPAYAERVARIGTTTLMVNALAAPDMMGGSFGGTWVVRPDDSVQASLPLGRTGMLLVDL